jgi:hypothetical protein
MMRVPIARLEALLTSVEGAVNALENPKALVRLTGPEGQVYFQDIYRCLFELRCFRKDFPDLDYQRIFDDQYGFRGEQ